MKITVPIFATVVGIAALLLTLRNRGRDEAAWRYLEGQAKKAPK